ncbi:MAG: M23 family metallopeptidase [[Eubacterium] siraeum]
MLGTEGNTGYSYGTHLHFDVFDGTQYVDPLPYLLGEKSFIRQRSLQALLLRSEARSE